MTAYEERQKLLDASLLLHARITEMFREVQKVVGRLIAEADSLIPAAADEVEAGQTVTVRPVKFGKVGTLATAIASGQTKRTCSLCHEPGHTAPNCPNAHKVREAKIAAQAERKPKRTMKPLTEEQKQKRRESLVKARAARGKK